MWEKGRKPEGNIHLKVDKTLLDLISDYHDQSPNEVVTYFYGLAKDMYEVKGNVVNKEKTHIPVKRTSFSKYIPVEVEAGSIDYDAYCLRGFYPNSKIPFKVSGVKRSDFGCFVVTIGDKNKEIKFDESKLKKIEQAAAEAILLDKKPEDVSDNLYKPAPFRLMTPKGLSKHEKES